MNITRDVSLDQWELTEGASDGSMPLADANWVATAAPGDTYLALHRAGRLPHPFHDCNEKSCAWVAERHWWWRTRFEAARAGVGERVLLRFEGLDTYADVWLNGELIGSSRNMFTPLICDVSSRLREGFNELSVRFTPPADVVREREVEAWPLFAHLIVPSKRTLHRKAQFGWGWDWAPKLPTVGICGPVQLLRQRRANIENVRFTTLSIAPEAEVQIEVEVDVFALESALGVDVQLIAPDGSVAGRAQTVLDGTSRVAQLRFRVANPQLWWTADLGEPTLYRLEAKIHAGGECLERRELLVGLRTIELDTSPDSEEPGCDFFRFRLNGVNLFARGVNWVPASSFIAELTPSHYQRLLREAAAANVNMVRVWGGGIYEPDAFYEACDALGMLVWQDFMFACAPYPEDDAALVDSIRQEIEFQVRRLRHHPCLAMWCGENEGQLIQQLVNLESSSQQRLTGALYFEELIPEILGRLDPQTPYRPGSPYGGPIHNSMRAGDVHNWTVWHGFPPMPDAVPVGQLDSSPQGVAYTHYAEDKARFVSEFGIQGAPARATLERWTSPGKLALDSKELHHRTKDHPKNKLDAMLIPVTGRAPDLDRYFLWTQLVQAEGLKFGIEHYRRRMPHCSGTVIWQFNDCWPGISWSLIDYDGVRKASWYYVARAYAPLLASFRQCDDGSVELWLTHNGVERFELPAQVTLESFDGSIVREESLTLTASANASACVWRLEASALQATPDRLLRVTSPRFHSNRLFFAPFKDLPLSGELPAMQVRNSASGSLEIGLTGVGYHAFVHFLSDAADIAFDDNFFDLRRGETRWIKARAPGRSVSPQELRLASYRPG